MPIEGPVEGEIPEGISPDARETWPSSELISSWLGDVDLDVEWRPGETSDVAADDLEAVAAARRFRDVLGRFASGVTVVTAMSGGEPVGMTCQSFSSVSLDPPLVLFIPARTSRAWPMMQRAGRFCVNFLAHDQADLSNAMASRGNDKFAGLAWTPSAGTGSPVLPGTLGHVDCTIHAVHEAGDHFVVIGRVLDLVASDEAELPLLYYQGQYRTTT
ncbi:flavin reductase family protein [Nocardioides litoris]|uniref:flavin reductase family protein n=1 Tax=Nocardioides litoris TaxID=1926648 RepID=UPI001FE49F3D|nr:flavin reductase family protein [Nocardioides litoris]